MEEVVGKKKEKGGKEEGKKTLGNFYCLIGPFSRNINTGS